LAASVGDVDDGIAFLNIMGVVPLSDDVSDALQEKHISFN
jgi:hypothetical protein